MEHYGYELWQDGIVVASVEAPDEATAYNEIMHYAMIYAQDGPCQVKRAPQVSGKER